MTVVDKCYAKLRAQIVRGDYPPDTRIPAERKLADSMGVNRVTVRSALARLADANLLTVRQGSGYQVCDFRRTGGPNLLGEVMDRSRELGIFNQVAADLLMVRRHLAGAVLERLLQRPATPQGIDAIANAIDGFEQAVQQNATSEELAAQDLNIVSALIDATGSPVLGLCLNPIIAVLDTQNDLRRAVYAQPQLNLVGWRALQPWLVHPTGQMMETILTTFAARDLETVQSLIGEKKP